jgi:AraC-like DNA-binding protein
VFVETFLQDCFYHSDVRRGQPFLPRYQYLVLGAPLPLECEAHASHDEPFISLLINIDMRLLQKLVWQTEAALKPLVHKDQSAKQLINTTQLNQPMQAASIRLLECLQDPLDAKVLAANIVQEIVYRTLLGPSGPIIYGLIHQDGHYRRIVGALNHIYHHYPDSLTVDQLAATAGMSVSVFCKSFKKITYHSPLQYIKKVRLNKAKELMLLNGIKANHVAHQVGYESASQFSREFKRYFNHSPSQIRQSTAQASPAE